MSDNFDPDSNVTEESDLDLSTSLLIDFASHQFLIAQLSFPSTSAEPQSDLCTFQRIQSSSLTDEPNCEIREKINLDATLSSAVSLHISFWWKNEFIIKPTIRRSGIVKSNFVFGRVLSIT
jgi:hypothetical protein